MANLSDWRDAINEELVHRLTRPLRQPGMMQMGMSRRIINRCDRFLNRLPLLNQQMQRWGNTNTLSSELLPIVYAQPASTVSPVQTTANIIQRKLDSSSSLPIQSVNNTPDLSSSDFTDVTTPINQTSISSSAIPVVTSAPITEELPIFPPTKSELTLNHPSQPIRDTPSIFSSPITEQSPKSEEMALTETTLPISPPTKSELTLNYPSQPIRYTPYIFSSELPIVLPQPISKQPKPEEILLTTKSQLNPNHQFPAIVTIKPITEKSPPSDQRLPIIQAKLQNYSPAQPSLPLINDLSDQQQTQLNKHDFVKPLSLKSEQNEVKNHQFIKPISVSNKDEKTDTTNTTDYLISIKHENLISQISQRLPIVTAQPPTSQVNLTNHKQDISPLPLISINSINNQSSKPQPLPLPIAKSNQNQQLNLSKPNSISNTNLSSPTQTFSPRETAVSPIANSSSIDINAIASQVERKLMRRLVIESERRGKSR
ncbi:hypothetical protein [Nostoc sp. TCL26-01]|uniref:hypothetical protein n=1 Tax=Nostoc sp. TCL26-01 TaxID=2576904 RepID=UPI0015C186E3|nr:hypothetical protein [Nostoc sp. TCL26-01]QLE58021.1 hypothetical protein FD725_22390 [Nostoc sp. TCL26-01]